MKTLKDELWKIISGDFCDVSNIPDLCPKDDDGSEVSCEWCKTIKVYKMLAQNNYGKMVLPDKKYIGGFKVHPQPEFEPIKDE